MSEGKTLRFRIRSGDFEVELEGDSDYVKPSFEKLLEELRFKTRPTAVQIPAAIPEETAEGLPSTIAGRIEHLVKNGFLDQPRKLSDVVQELGREGFPYDVKTVDNTLRILLRKALIRRLGVRGHYEYVIR
jgi:hypothetical protein